MEGQELCIKDTGIGIKNSDVLRVFERGFSGYNGRLTQQSSGLGLYLSKKISEELGHQIRIESEVGKGTIVRIQFAQVNLVLEWEETMSFYPISFCYISGYLKTVFYKTNNRIFNTEYSINTGSKWSFVCFILLLSIKSIN